MDSFDAFGLVILTVGQFLWTRYSRLARTRASVITTAVVGSLLLILFMGARLSMTASLAGASFELREIAVYGLFVLGYLGATGAGWFARQRKASVWPPG